MKFENPWSRSSQISPLTLETRNLGKPVPCPTWSVKSLKSPAAHAGEPAKHHNYTLARPPAVWSPDRRRARPPALHMPHSRFGRPMETAAGPPAPAPRQRGKRPAPKGAPVATNLAAPGAAGSSSRPARGEQEPPATATSRASAAPTSPRSSAPGSAARAPQRRFQPSPSLLGLRFPIAAATDPHPPSSEPEDLSQSALAGDARGPGRRCLVVRLRRPPPRCSSVAKGGWAAPPRGFRGCCAVAAAH